MKTRIGRYNGSSLSHFCLNNIQGKPTCLQIFFCVEMAVTIKAVA